MKSAKVDSVCAKCGLSYRKRADRVQSPDFCSLSCRTTAIALAADKRRKDCIVCNSSFIPRQYQLRHGGGNYCSMKCVQSASTWRLHTPEAREKARKTWRENGNREKMSARRGPKHPDFLGMKVVDGYVWVWVDDVRGYMAEHRLIAEKTIGRSLSETEVVHHRNGIRADNRPENLQVMTRAAHMQQHKEEINNAYRASYKPRPQKLDESKVRFIRESYARGEKQVSIAAKVGVTPAMIGYVVRRDNWRLIP